MPTSKLKNDPTLPNLWLNPLMRWIYLSPHLDDAVLSAGGLIYDQSRSGIPVEIWTFMCGYPPEDAVSPFAEMLHHMWGFTSAEETIRSRREEDQQAAAIVGARLLHFDFFDCIYRRGAGGEWLYTEVFGTPHAADAALPSRIAAQVTRHLQPDDILVCQLSIGSHVDHVLVRQGVELLGRTLRYVIDVPYIFIRPEELGPKSVGMAESVQSITEPGVERWKEAALAYKSQLPGLGAGFETPEKTKKSIHSYWEPYGGIRLFQAD
jgi:LmbE family N-acetylglucosaminyl deacetylase